MLHRQEYAAYRAEGHQLYGRDVDLYVLREPAGPAPVFGRPGIVSNLLWRPTFHPCSYRNRVLINLRVQVQP